MGDGNLILVGGALLAAGLVMSLVATRVRLPALLLFLGIGMVIGDDGLSERFRHGKRNHTGNGHLATGDRQQATGKECATI